MTASSQKPPGSPSPVTAANLVFISSPDGAAGEEQVWQAGFRGDGPVDPQRVVDQDALRTPFDREPRRGRVAAHQRRFEPEVADDLQVGGDAAVGAEGARGRRAAHRELRDVRRGGVQRAGRRHRHVSIQTDASVGEAGQQRAVFLADGHQGVLDLEISRRALQLGRLQEGGGGEAVDRQIGGGGDAAAVLQGGDAAVDGADVRLEGAHAAVDGRDRASERVEGGHQRVAAVAAVRLDLDDAAVAQDGPPGEGRPEEQASYEAGRELLLDEVEEAVALGHRGVPHKIPGVERREVAVTQVPPVRFRLGVGVAVSSSVVSVRMVEAARGARGRRALIMGGVTLVRTRDSKLALALTAKYLWSASAWVRNPAPAMASSISVWVRELVQYWVNVAVSWESSSVRG